MIGRMIRSKVLVSYEVIRAKIGAALIVTKALLQSSDICGIPKKRYSKLGLMLSLHVEYVRFGSIHMKLIYMPYPTSNTT